MATANLNVNVDPKEVAKHLTLTVRGYCPLGCGETLMLCQDGYVTCSYADCPRPDAVSDIIGDRETEHVVQLSVDDFTVRHPLRERLDDELMQCELARNIAASVPPQPGFTGTYRVTTNPVGGWSWQRVSS